MARPSSATPLSRLRQALGLVAQARVPTITLKLPEKEAQKLTWLVKGGRDVEKPNGVMLREMGEAYATALLRVAKGKAGPTAPWLAAAEAWRDRVATRLATSGGDVKAEMRPLTPEYVRRKGFNRIGVNTGALLRAVSIAKITIRGVR